ncbi:MAG: tetratricopeptide repeat protein [Thermaerobacter sp.]|nr:tetratricopeptide repeat protein [Thermaerobacter sp.]
MSMADLLLDRGAPEAAHLVIQRAENVDRDLYGGRYAGDLYRLQGRLAYAQGRFDAACRSFAAMDRNARAHGGAPARARAGYDYGLALARSGRLEHALLTLTGAIKVAQAIGDLTLLGYSHWALGNLLSQIRDYPAAIAHYQQAARLLTDPDQAAYVRWGELCARWETSEPDVLASIMAFLPQSPPSLAAEVRSVVGALHRAAGALTQAQRWLEEAAATAEVGSAAWCTAQHELLTVYYSAGDESRACTVMQTLARHGLPRERTYVESLPSAWVASRWAPDLVADLLSAPTTANERTLDWVVRHRDSPGRGS